MDIAITPANVIPSAGASFVHGRIAGAAITAGQPVYKDTDGTIKPANATGAAPICNVIGIAVNNAAVGQPVSYVTADPALALGGTIAAGHAVVASGANTGGIAPIADVATGWFSTILGVGIGNNKINLNLVAAGVAAP